MSNTDPNAVPWYELSCMGLGKALGRVPLGGEMANMVCARPAARDAYMEVHPHLMRELNKRSPESELVLYLVKQLLDTAQWGACRANFRRFYVDARNEGPVEHPQPALMRKLPNDPDDITFGLWRAHF